MWIELFSSIEIDNFPVANSISVLFSVRFFNLPAYAAACATAYAGKLNNLTENNTDIEFANGKLSISIDENNSIHMKGPVSDIKEIKIKL